MRRTRAGVVANDARVAVAKRTVQLVRYANRFAADVTRELNDARDQLVGILSAQDPTAVSAGRVGARLASLQGKAVDILSDAYLRVRTLARRNLYSVAQVGALGASSDTQRIADANGIELGPLALPTANQLRAIVAYTPVQGAVSGTWWARQETATANAFQTQIQLGMTRGDALSTLVQRVRGVSLGGGRYDGGLMQTSTRNAQALVRTATHEIYGQAALQTYQDNDDVVEGVEFLSAEDERVCPECAALDGTVWATDDPKLQNPPIHWNCRCTLLPALNYAALGVSAPSTPPRQTYSDWFAGQSADTQDDILGPARAALVRSGDATFGDLLRRDGSMIPLAQLQAST